MVKAAAIVLVVVAAVVAAVTWVAHRHKTAPTRPAVLVISGDTAGWITPCGCTSNQSGGLLRRGTYLAELRKTKDVLYVDAGGAPAGTSPYQRVKFEAIVAGENLMGIRAHNIGGPETALGAAYLREVAARLNVPLISANARDESSALIAPACRIIEAGGRKVALIGIVSSKFAVAGIQIDEPRPAILNAIAQIKGRYELAIVLAYAPEEELAQLQSELPEVDAVIGGPTGQAIAPRHVGSSLIAAATNKGKFLIQLEIPAQGQRRIEGSVAEMGPSIADDAAQLANLRQYLATVEQRNFTAAQTGLAPAIPPDVPAAYRVAGSQRCTKCHEKDANLWTTSHHARAWQTLQPRGFHVDPDCLRCHTTGYGLPGGFDSLRSSGSMVGVGCESCHGPSQAHVADPKIHTPFLAADQCIRCHDHENSPHFEYSTYWGRVRHGKEAHP